MPTLFLALLILVVPIALAFVVVVCFMPSFQTLTSGLAAVDGVRQVLVKIGRLLGRGGESDLARVQRRVFAATIAQLPRSRAGVVFLPGQIVATVSAMDYSHIEGFVHVVEAELVAELRRHAARFGMSVALPLRATIGRDPALAEGQVRVDMSHPTELDGLRTQPLPPDRIPKPTWALSFPNLQIVQVADRPVVVGRRSAECTVVVGDPKVSGRHCEFARDGDKLRVTDLQSLNGLKVNGSKVATSHLNVGDKVTIGSTTVTVGQR